MLGSLFVNAVNDCQRWKAMANVLALSALLSACGGGGSSSPSATPVSVDPPAGDEEQAELLISLTDAEGDFLTYLVDVTGMTLTHTNGAVVNVLPETTSVDFAQYVDVSEMLTVASVPFGTYESMDLSLDFSSAQITVQDEAGQPIVAAVVDEAGDPVTQLDVTLTFNGNEAFVLRPSMIPHLTLDFDLDASNDVEITDGHAVVTVKPVLLADTQHDDPKPLRLRGLLGRVDVEAEQFVVELRPFRKRLGRFGDVVVNVDAETGYEVDGEMLENDAGLEALAALDPASPVVVAAEWDRGETRFLATQVLAGSSVPWDNADILRGTVVARDGSTVSVRGAIIEVSDGRFVFNDTVNLTIGDATAVNKRAEEADIADISVGSALHAVGTLVDDNSLDATNGIVRIYQSNIAGTVNSEEPLSIDLQFINGRRASLFDFAGTGVDEASDADPGNYEVDTSTLDLSGLFPQDPVRVRGFVSEFGTAPMDFEANTVINAADVRGLLTVTYISPGSETALTTASEEGIVFGLDDVARKHHIRRAGVAIDLLELDSPPPIVPAADRGIYSIAVDRRIALYFNYSEFVDALNAYIEQSLPVQRIDAHGTYESMSNAFSSKRLRVYLRNVISESE